MMAYGRQGRKRDAMASDPSSLLTLPVQQGMSINTLHSDDDFTNRILFKVSSGISLGGITYT